MSSFANIQTTNLALRLVMARRKHLKWGWYRIPCLRRILWKKNE
ncbi:unnamed protein product, partial [Ixodes persulcatus]